MICALVLATVYLLGDLGILPLAGFDSSWPAMAQGPTRLARGQAFGRYMIDTYGATSHTVVIVPLCGHNARCLLTAEPALPRLFPKVLWRRCSTSRPRQAADARSPEVDS